MQEASESALSEEQAAQARKTLKVALLVGVALAVLGGLAGAWHGASLVGESSEIMATWKRVEVTVLDVRQWGTLRKPKTNVSIEYVTDGGTQVQVSKTRSGKSKLAVGSTYEAYVSPTDRTDVRHVASVTSNTKHGKPSMMRRGAIFGAIALPGLSMLLVIFGFTALTRVRS